MSSVLPTSDGIRLLKDEAGGLMREFGITTISFYESSSRPDERVGDHSDIVASLRAQFARVVIANPWLAGRLVKTKNGVILRHPSAIELDTADNHIHIDSLFTATASDATDPSFFRLNPTSPYTTICSELYKAKHSVIVGPGTSLIGKDKPVALLTVTESAPGAFVLIFSMSHVIGDGRTYYEIFKMLQPGADVRELVSAREMSFSERMRDMCGRKELAWVDSTSAALLYTRAMMFGGKPKCFAFHLDDEKLAAAKALGVADNVEYVTTNDILTSGFFNACRARIGMMGVDYRGRVDGIGEDMAGNYVTALVIDDEVFATPATLRNMYTTTPYRTTRRPLPGCCCGNGRFAMVTNWSSFAGDLVTLDDCELVFHLPVQNPAYCTYDLMIPFASRRGKRGVLCWTVSSDEVGLRAALPVGENISEKLFPPDQA